MRDFHRLQLDGTSVAYWTSGDGMPLVCLHAVGHSSEDFAALPERMPGPLRWIALDWPGHGASGRDRVPASAARYAEILARFLGAAEIEAPVLLGNSIGGAAAVRFAAAHPAAARGLILANPGGLAPVDAAARAFCRVLAAFFRAGARRARWFPAAFDLYYRTVLQAPPARARRRRIVASAYEVAPVLAEAWESFGRADADVRPLLPHISCPVLFTWATGDRVVSLARSRDAIASLARARVQPCRGGHAAFLEDPETFDVALRTFLAELGVDEHAQPPGYSSAGQSS
jgi:pimeloyl-ACP methyl ester carboxylesterase